MVKAVEEFASAPRTLFQDYQDSSVAHIGPQEVEIIFQRSIYRRIIASRSFRRLKNISFLGAIEYVRPRHRGVDGACYTRFQHSLGVAKLALQFARKCQLNEREEILIVL